MTVVKWNEVLDEGVLMPEEVRDFVEGRMSGRTLLETVRCYGGNNRGYGVDKLLRTRGVAEARSVAKKALQRRNLI